MDLNDEVIDQEVDEKVLEQTAVARFLSEVTLIKNTAYQQKMNPVLLMEVRMAIKGVLTKYQKYGFFLGETVEVSLRDRKNFLYSPIHVQYSPDLYEKIKAAIERLTKDDS